MCMCLFNGLNIGTVEGVGGEGLQLGFVFSALMTTTNRYIKYYMVITPLFITRREAKMHCE